MPELPEVEQFRKILLPLVSETQVLEVELTSETPPKTWLSKEDVEVLHQNVVCTDIVRKGKQLCILLQNKETSCASYLFLHMGMTGAIKSPGVQTFWGHEGRQESPMQKREKKQAEEEEEEFPPRYTYLTLKVGEYRVAFTDPRKFGKCELLPTLESLDALAPDALLGICTESDKNKVLPRIANQTLGIKGLLLDQKRAVSGVGNWVADELFYQLGMHPDQNHLSETQAKQLLEKLFQIVDCAVDCLAQGRSYPSRWLFPYRWTGKKAGKDSQGHPLYFLKSGGRTSAIVLSLQKLKKQSTTSSPPKKNKKTNAKDHLRQVDSAKARGGKKRLQEDVMENDTKPSKNVARKRKKQVVQEDQLERKLIEPVSGKRRSSRLAAM